MSGSGHPGEGGVVVERDGAVLVVTIDRPQARNAVNRAVAEGIGAAMDELDGDDSLFVGVVTGAGGTFSAGMDLKAFLAGEKPHVPGRGFAGLVERPPRKPLIAAVEGYALAGGFEIALACDLVVAAEGASFGLPEVKRGLLAGGGGLLRLPVKAGLPKATEWALTGDRVSAADAHAAGVVNRLVPDGEALPAALELARQIAANGPLAVQGTKRILAEGPGWPAEEAFARQWEVYAPIRASEDAQEGARAFTEKRAPVWRGR
ncbi:crotonase/enoyl-CoA hydratase family protein [Geodermatophilus marinus]|uniref:crotonase/enoyl-CoA hydratase family protein n=1 Tax=Geodermatophilus sp. LHW52908 TaxID=2303986 RepID=UPI000E3E8F4E|nr:crotonase/enoyl-CoA hydratase family protein [Geodermatophilus sp. LHW52908]RFU19537.1 enoyl-CoA hydratase [Geodermatophilus sp. LHW52908]